VSSNQTFLKIADNDEILEKHKNHLETLEKQLKALHKALDLVVKQRLGMR
jgi:hypothetical protein